VVTAGRWFLVGWLPSGTYVCSVLIGAAPLGGAETQENGVTDNGPRDAFLGRACSPMGQGSILRQKPDRSGIVKIVNSNEMSRKLV
jgi:hypothetical protein